MGKLYQFQISKDWPRTVGESLGDPDLPKEQTKRNKKRFEQWRKHESSSARTKELWLSTHLNIPWIPRSSFCLLTNFLKPLSIASSIDNIDKKPLLNLVPLEKSSIKLGLERILRLAEITWPWWESIKLGKRKQTQPEWIILLTCEAQTDLPNAS